MNNPPAALAASLPAEAALAAACLAIVVLLILGAARAARMLPALRQPKAMPGALTLRGCLALDRQRRLYLVEAEGVWALILAGGGGDALQLLPGKDENVRL